MTTTENPRKPRVFQPDHPSLVLVEAEPAEAEYGAAGPDTTPPPTGVAASPSAPDLSSGIRWGVMFASAMAGLAALAAGVWFARFVSVALAREDWVGWTAFCLSALAGGAAAVILVRELVGLLRVRRLGRLRDDAEAAFREQDLYRERTAVHQLCSMLRTRPELAWSLVRFREHESDVRDPGELFLLAERKLIVPLDLSARRVVLASAKRVSMVTALSPMVLIAVAYVLIENLRMLRALAAFYGGQPGFIGALKLARMVLTHLLATGSLALTDDLLGQFLGQDVLRRLSRRLGEGVFNAAMTVRIGTAAIEVIRPLPFIEAPPIRVRDFVTELLRRPPGESKPAGR